MVSGFTMTTACFPAFVMQLRFRATVPLRSGGSSEAQRRTTKYVRGTLNHYTIAFAN